jgi:hypothetical protein
MEPVDSRNQTETCQWEDGRPDARQEPGPGDGRALRVQGVIDGWGPGSSVSLDRLARTVTSAASSSAVGMPLVTLTSGSSLTVRAYDDP